MLAREGHEDQLSGVSPVGHAFDVPEFGRVYIGEVLAQYRKRTVTMLRFVSGVRSGNITIVTGYKQWTAVSTILVLDFHLVLAATGLPKERRPTFPTVDPQLTPHGQSLEAAIRWRTGCDRHYCAEAWLRTATGIPSFAPERTNPRSSGFDDQALALLAAPLPKQLAKTDIAVWQKMAQGIALAHLGRYPESEKYWQKPKGSRRDKPARVAGRSCTEKRNARPPARGFNRSAETIFEGSETRSRSPRLRISRPRV